MIEIKNRQILDDGTVICSSAALTEVLYSGENLSGLYCDNEADQQEWNAAQKLCDTNEIGPKFCVEKQYQNINWNQYWFTPAKYQEINIKDYCINLCKTNEEINRVNLEISEFEKRNMIPLMQHLIYCRDIWIKNNIVWGVGRGSSVSSFVLYLIGINKINPLKYNLDISEWLKD